MAVSSDGILLCLLRCHSCSLGCLHFSLELLQYGPGWWPWLHIVLNLSSMRQPEGTSEEQIKWTFFLMEAPWYSPVPSGEKLNSLSWFSISLSKYIVSLLYQSFQALSKPPSSNCSPSFSWWLLMSFPMSLQISFLLGHWPLSPMLCLPLAMRCHDYLEWWLLHNV